MQVIQPPLLPPDTKPFEPPQAKMDAEQPRYLVFMGNLVDRQAQLDRPLLRGGGFEVHNVCLRYVRHFLRRGRITPLLRDTYPYLPRDFVRKAFENEAGFFPQPIPSDYRAPLLPEGAGPSPVGTMLGKLALPGEQIASIVEGPENIIGTLRRGIVELRTLRGHPYNPTDVGRGLLVDREIWRIQTAILPNFPVLPTRIVELKRLLDAAYREHTELRDIIADMQLSLSQFEDYAVTIIRQVHTAMREGATQGYLRPYTGTDLVLLEQLNMEREDGELHAERGADQDLKDVFLSFLKGQQEERELLLNSLRSEPVDPAMLDRHGQPLRGGAAIKRAQKLSRMQEAEGTPAPAPAEAPAEPAEAPAETPAEPDSEISEPEEAPATEPESV